MANLFDKFNHFTESEIPYDLLAEFGLSQEMIDDLPASVQQRLLSGRTTPPLPVISTNADGQQQMSMACICLIRKDDGSVDFGLVPEWKSKELSEYEEEQQRQLLLGNVIIAELAEKGSCFVQYDENIRQTKVLPISLISRNLENISQKAGLNSFDESKLMNGEIVEIENDGNIISLGVDLNEMTGCRISNGDAQLWKEEAKADMLPQYNFGIFGCWVKDPIDKSLRYVNEDDYTPEMMQEIVRTGAQKAAKVQMGGGRHR